MKKRFGAGKSYSDILTVLLVIIIIAILSLLGYFTYKVIHKNKVESDNMQGLDDLHAAQEENKKWQNIIGKNETIDTPSNETGDKVSDIDYSNLINNQANPEENPGSTQTPSSNKNVKKAYLGKYEIKGEIYIPKTNCNYVILNSVSADALSKAVGILDIVPNGDLNEDVSDLNVPGSNAFILGHNYLNGQFFSDNDKLVNGDKIYITDQLGTKVTYTIYDMFYAPSSDASFMTRQVDSNTREITLQTCNDNSTERLIILAKDN